MAKGGECDNVALMTGLSRANRDEMEINSDDTNRTFYVGVTRAKKSLHVVKSGYGDFII
jgi:superfamily I DNA/RNA helicase